MTAFGAKKAVKLKRADRETTDEAGRATDPIDSRNPALYLARRATALKFIAGKNPATGWTSQKNQGKR